jgi:diguanylate cyclase (GGDEF)-like protein
MSQHETIAAFFASQLDFIFFSYGLAFILLGAVCFAVARLRDGEVSWQMLGFFGATHGAGEWLDLLALVVTDSETFRLVRMLLMTGSFLLLMEFARRKAIRFGARLPALPLYLVVVSLVALGGAVGGLAMAGAFARYVIGFTAAIAASSVFALQAREFSGITKGLACLAAAGFALYAVAAGLIVPAAPFWPANIINQTWFFQQTGIPVQLLRGLLACMLAFSVWAIWGQFLIAEVSLDRYTRHLQRHFIWTLTALAAILMFGWTLTQFLGITYERNLEESAQGDINLLASRLNSETAIVDGMVRALAGTPSLLPLLTRTGGADERRARSILDLDVEASGARYGGILDLSGTLVASSDQFEGSDASRWRSAPWFQKSLAGQAGYHFTFDPADRGRYYYASYPVRHDDGSIAGVAFLQKSLGQFEADLTHFARSYFFIDPDGIVVLTNRPAEMLRTFWPLSAETKSTLTPQFGSLNDRPMVGRAPEDATWVSLDGEQNLVRRIAAPHSRWSVLLAAPKSRIYANRISGIVITLLATMMALFYFFGREHGIRDRIQMDKRAELQELAQKLRFKATTDPLTGLYNRSKFNEALASEMARSYRYGSPLALIMFDVDHFKRVNDVYGHQTGDAVLVQLSELVSGNVRKTDLLARWGGEEFVILTPGLDGATAYQAAEKLKAIIGQGRFNSVETITCSFGLAQYFKGDTPGTLLERADSALYRAKVNGRNRVELAPAPGANGVASVA